MDYIFNLLNYKDNNFTTIKMSKRTSFLNSKKTINLPSNLLNIKKQDNDFKADTIHAKNNRFWQSPNRYFKSIQPPAYVGEKSESKDKQVLYKRLSNIRGQNKQIGNLSFSKMLSRMVVLDDDEVEEHLNEPFQTRMRQTVHVTSIPPKLYNINYSKPASRAPSRSIELDQVKKPSKKLFKKYYLPSSQATQNYYLQTGNPGDKYIYRDGKKVQCKRIHNFYTSHMFRNGYDKCFRKTTSSFKSTI